jgi:Sigma-70 region 2
MSDTLHIPVKKKRAPRHYVNNGQLYEELVAFKEKCLKAREEGKPEPRLSNYVGQCILLICQRIGTRPNFSGYSYRDEMVDDAIENCVAAISSFDPAKSNHPFNYLSTVAMNAMIRRIQKEKRETYMKHKTMQMMATHLEGGAELADERSQRVVSDFETKLAEKKAKDAEKAAVKRGLENFIPED